MVAFVPIFVAQHWADWYNETLDQVEAAGGDRRRFADVDPVLEKRLAEDPPAPCTVGHVADQVDHVRAVAGVDHVGLGGDYDGATVFPSAWTTSPGIRCCSTSCGRAAGRSRSWRSSDTGTCSEPCARWRPFADEPAGRPRPAHDC